MPNLREMTIQIQGKLAGSMLSTTQRVIQQFDMMNGRVKALKKSTEDLTRYVKLGDSLQVSGKALMLARSQVARLEKEMASAATPAKGLATKLKAARIEAAGLETKVAKDGAALAKLRSELRADGVSVKDVNVAMSKLDSELRTAESRADRTRKVLATLQSQSQKTGNAAKEMGRGFQFGLTSMAKTALGAAGLYIGMSQLVDATKSCLQASGDMTRVNDRLRLTMLHTKGTTAADVKAVMDYSDAQIKNLAISEKTERMAISQMATSGLQRKSIQTLIPALNDIMAAREGAHVSIEAGMKYGTVLSRALQGNATALGRIGIVIPAALNKQLKAMPMAQRAQAVANIIESRIGGMAGKAAQGPEGQSERLKVAFEQVRREVGDKLLPIWTKALRYLSDHIPQIRSAVMRVVGGVLKFIDAVRSLWKIGVTVFTWYQKHLSFLTPIILGIIGAFEAWRIATLIAAGAQAILNGVMFANPVGLIIAGIGALIGVIYILVTHWKQVCAWLGKVWDWFKRLWGSVSNWGPFKAVAGAIGDAWSAVVGVVQKLWDKLKAIWELAQKAANWITSYTDEGKSSDAEMAEGHAAFLKVHPELATHPAPGQHSAIQKTVVKEIIKNTLPHRALGGLVAAGRPYLVGERGPELFIPRPSGLIRPNLAGAGAGGIQVTFGDIIINGPASRSNVVGAIGQATDDLERRLEKIMDDRRRRSME